MADSRLFHPIKVCNLELAHRIAMAPLTRLRATIDHVPTPLMEEYYTQRAAVPGTLLISEATLISPSHAGIPYAPAIWNEIQASAWRGITDAVHARGCSIICQLVAPGRAADPAELRREGGGEMLS